MRAIEIAQGKGPASAMHVAQIKKPEPGPGELLIRVAAAGVNRPDIAQREGLYPPPPGVSPVLGLEVSGVVEALGEGCGTWRKGDRLCALLPGGGYAEYAVVDARHALPVPGHILLETAAGFPETIFTVYANMFERARLAAGERVLIHGGNSGIGVTAIQMAKAAGAHILTTVRGPEKAARAMEIGADLAIDVLNEDFADRCRAEGGVDVILDMLGGDYFARNIASLNPDGRLVQIAALAGGAVEVNLFEIIFKRLTITASTLRARSADEKARLTAAIYHDVWPWVEEGRVAIPIDRIFPLEEASAAHSRLEKGQQFGKVILSIG
ncbi:NAD(P)H-quinone oxidoreductase [Sphingobium sp. WCS2017Hpa-17]|uniref:NAD(P)H-quinone oxidoreductase n=1 Tax=Sphingobium sp. WCS2017Hpa-17 TaxID=3073638 RepID=UPI00288C0F6A|nr:NAD(P)H-quinone oxidoreductase [Sphingobium sp. WCS2017Hpa-17]